MPSKHDPANSLADIIDNAARIEKYLAGVSREQFERSDMMLDAVERCLERICEATHRLGPLAAELLPGHPVGDIKGMGNWLRHAYDGIDPEVIWHAARDDAPSLSADARQTLTRLEVERATPPKP